MKDVSHVCPQCASPAIDRSSLAGGRASCRNAECGWEGPNTETYAVAFEHDFSSTEQVQMHFVRQLTRVVLHGLTDPLGRLLVQWGFIDVEKASQELPYYIRAAAGAVAQAVIETRDAIARGEVPGGR